MKLSVVILAAGRGKRMKSLVPKVLHEALGRPMLQHVIEAVKPLKPDKTLVVIGNGAELVKKRVQGESLSFAVQNKLIGTGNALSIAGRELSKGTVLVLNGDCPLITTRTLRGLLHKHRRDKNALSFLSFIDESMSGYGRLIRDHNGRLLRVIEDKHASFDEKKTCNELNGGVYVLEAGILHYLNKIKKNRSSGEYYLTDIISIVSDAEKRLNAYDCPQEEIRGVNNRAELCETSEILRKRVIDKLMEKGVTFIDPGASVVQPSASIGRDSVIYPNTYIEGKTSLGKRCVIFPGVRICDSVLGDEVTVKDNTLIEKSRIGRGASLGPCAHVRPFSVLGRDVKIGNFVEIKKSIIGDGTKASHLTYLGDAKIGSGVNIGAGTITCNYDGKNKFETVIKPGVFIGSDTQLVAPVTIGKGAYVAAGATITSNVPSGALAISRTKQRNLNGWVQSRTSGPGGNRTKVKSKKSGIKRGGTAKKTQGRQDVD